MRVLSFTSPEAPEAAFVRRSTIKDLHPDNRLAAWQSLLAETSALLPELDAAETAQAALSCWMFGDVVFTRTLYHDASDRRWQHRPRSFPDHWCVVLAHSRADRQDLLAVATPHQGSLSFQSLDGPFEARSTDTDVLTLFLPLDFCRDELDAFALVPEPEIHPELAALLAGYMDNLARQLPHISQERAQGLAAATCSLVAACIAPRPERSEAAEAPIAALLIDRARLVVRQNMASPEFGPDQLARLLAMSRSKLYRFFESTGGVAHFINRERLREAHRRLAASRDGLSIHVIGNEVGFMDHSTFSRAFRREFGCSPTEARERSLARLSAEPPGLAFPNATPAIAPSF